MLYYKYCGGLQRAKKYVACKEFVHSLTWLNGLNGGLVELQIPQNVDQRMANT